MDIEQRLKDITYNQDPVCKHYIKDPYPHCLGQKNAPPTDCGGFIYNCDVDKREKNMVNHPAHYNTGSIECIDALAAATEGLTGIEAFCTANAIKYLWRWKWKSGIQDLDKAIWYINHLKEQLAKND